MKLYYANSSIQDADIVIVGLPYDRTSSFVPGARFGPEYVRICAENIEDYSPYQEKSLGGLKIHDYGDIYFQYQDWMAHARRVFDAISAKKKIIALGGEHTVTLPLVTWCKKHYSQFSVIHFDAHCDLRDEYLGEKVCHATVMRRVSEIVGIDNVYQFGIRSGTKEEFAHSANLYKFEVFKPLSTAIDEIKEPIYLSIDVDVSNPGAVPAVSTPEPGGISYKELIDSLLLLKTKKIIGADIVEYNPLAASPWASGSTVAEVLRELILIISS